MSTKKAKLVLLGAASVGKTSIVLRFVRNEYNRYNESTIGAAFISYPLKLDNNETVNFDIWDTAGQERYESIAPMYYRGASTAFVVYDITSNRSYSRAKKWVKVLKRDLGDVILILVGNKSDLSHKRVINVEEAEKYAKDQDILFYETSAKDNKNVRKIFQIVGLKICEKYAERIKSVKNNKGGNNPYTITLAELGEKDEKRCEGCTFIHS